ncbi:hypothetical protein V6N11_047678 [Hibiscus sabdariffa]|uniref:Uncharacterized protein n=2 Tax=Hibiscus sabdariffa TaxID=183260 RepID=A0ABR2P7P3_9ROSI
MAALILTLQSCFVHRKPPAGDLCPDCWMCNVDVEAMMGAPGEGIGAGHAIILHVKLAKVNGIISNDSTEKSFKRNSNAVTVTPSETIQNVKDAASNICMSKTCRGSKPIRSNYRNTKYRFFIKATKQIYHQTASKKESLVRMDLTILHLQTDNLSSCYDNEHKCSEPPLGREIQTNTSDNKQTKLK